MWAGPTTDVDGDTDRGRARTVVGMGMLGEMFPGRKIRDESGEDGNGQQWQLGPIDLDNRTVEVQAVQDESQADPED